LKVENESIKKKERVRERMRRREGVRERERLGVSTVSFRNLDRR